MRHRTRRGFIFWAAIVVVAYGFLSIAVGMATAGECGDLDANKTWNLFPPGWECERF